MSDKPSISGVVPAATVAMQLRAADSPVRAAMSRQDSAAPPPLASIASGTTACWPMAPARPTWRWCGSCCTSSPLQQPRPGPMGEQASCPRAHHRPSSAGTAATPCSSCRPSCVASRFVRHRLQGARHDFSLAALPPLADHALMDLGRVCIALPRPDRSANN